MKSELMIGTRYYVVYYQHSPLSREKRQFCRISGTNLEDGRNRAEEITRESVGRGIFISKIVCVKKEWVFSQSSYMREKYSK